MRRRKNTVWRTSEEQKNCLSVISLSVCKPVVLLHHPSVHLSSPSRSICITVSGVFLLDSTHPIYSLDYTTDTKYCTNKSTSNILPYGMWIMNLPEGVWRIVDVQLEIALEAGMRNWEKEKKKKAARGRDQSRKRESEDTLLCSTRLSNLTHTLLNRCTK